MSALTATSWSDRITAADADWCGRVHGNNCYEDYAQRNGAELARLLEET